MSIFDRLGRCGQPRQEQQQPTRQQIMENTKRALDQLRADPAGIARQQGLDIPAGMTDPAQMVRHILNSGQGGPRAQMARALMQQMGLR